MVNYRPVSNLSFISKVLEKVVDKQLKEYLFENNLSEPLQSAYRKYHSTETALVRVQNDIICAVGEQRVILLVLLDLSAAFDTVDHHLLLAILEQLGIQATALQWFSSYLENRHQSVYIKGQKSDTKLLNSGVPQGSVLGPTLFTLYTASLGQLLRKYNMNYHLYADDTQVYITCRPQHIDSAISQIETCIASVKRWMSTHHLKLNDNKTEFLVISSKPLSKRFKPPLVHIGESVITPSTSAKNIGVIMNSCASMDDHISSICKSSFLYIRNIGKLKPYLDRASLETIIHAFITTKLDYCNSLFCGISKSQLSRLQRVQNTVARILTGFKKSDHITPILFSLHWLPVEERVKFKVLIMVHKVVFGSAPQYLKELLHIQSSGRTLRSSNQYLLSVPFTKSSLVQNCAFSVAGPRLWNSLPVQLRSTPSLPQFKKQLKTFLFAAHYNTT
jgi:hypothetical protein